MHVLLRVEDGNASPIDHKMPSSLYTFIILHFFSGDPLFHFMALKSYNLEGEARAGQTLVGNWYEDRHWQDNVRGMQRSSHGLQMTAQPGYEDKKYKSNYQKTYKPPEEHHRKLPPRQARREREAMMEIARDLRTEELATEDHSMYFTRGRYLHEPQFHEDLKLDYLTDEPLTLYSDRPHNFGRDSHFSKPIQEYTGHEKVKDD